MGVNHENADALLGAWALDALDDAQRAELDEALAGSERLRRAAEGLQHAVALLGELDADAPPPTVRARLLSEIRRCPAATAHVIPSSPVDVVGAQIDAVRALLESLRPQDWQAQAAPYPWSVHGLAAHLLVSERYTAHVLGLEQFDGFGADADDRDHLALGAAIIEAEVGRPPAHTAAEWHARASATIGAVGAWPPPERERSVSFHGWPLSVSAVLIVRGFEMWTHADDIRRATGRPVEAPAPSDLRAMSTYSVNSLPLLVPQLSHRSARVVLTGPGGGTFDLGMPSGERALTLVADVVDYCRLVARRIEPDDLRSTTEGDRGLARELMAASRVFAM